jgi:hypothetical protein
MQVGPRKGKFAAEDYERQENSFRKKDRNDADIR